MDVFEYSESDVLYTQLSLFQKFMKRHSLDKMTAPIHLRQKYKYICTPLFYYDIAASSLFAK